MAKATQLANCPSPYNGDPCVVAGSAACSMSGGWYTCSFTNSSDDEIWSIMDQDETWVWGHVGETEFCCSTGDVIGIKPVSISTDDGDDIVHLRIAGPFAYTEQSRVDTGDGDDEVYGSSYTGCTLPCDDIDVGDGNDYVEAFDGEDYITAGTTNSGDINTLYGGDAGDLIEGGSGLDYLYGDAHVDVIYGYGGGDYIIGGSHDDWLSGGLGDDWIYGIGGDDKLCGDSGADTMDGGVGGTDICYEDGYDTTSNCTTSYASCPAPPF